MGKQGEPPVPPLNLVADYGGGSMFLIMGILSAIIERGISGKGQIVDAPGVQIQQPGPIRGEPNKNLGFGERTGA